MRYVRVKAVARKEAIQIIRDPLSLALAFLMPALLLLIFGYAITFDIGEISTVVYDRDLSPSSRQMIGDLKATGYFSVKSYIERPDEIDSRILNGDARVALMIPEGFEKDITIGRPQIGVIIDGSDSNTASIAEGYLSGLGSRLGSGRINSTAPRIDLRSRIWYNEDLVSRNFIIPGLIAVIMTVIAALLTSLTIAREWDRGTMEQLISTPIKPSELILGKIAPYFIIGVMDTALAVVMAVGVFDVPLRGSVLLLSFISSVFLFGGLGFGMLLSIAARTQLLASQAALLGTFLPAFLLSGFIFSISNMPHVLQTITYIIPARYLVTALKGIFLKASTLRMLILEAVLLTMYGAIVFMAAGRKLRKRL